MIFSGDLCQKVLDGTKTVTRRPFKGGIECRYVEGKTYAVQPKRGYASVGRFRVLSVRREALSELTETEAVAEGFANSAEFWATWARLYPKRNGGIDPEQLVWRIEFEIES